MAPQWIGRGYFWQAAVTTLVVGAINLVANFMLIPSHGMRGAVIAFIGTYAFAVIGNGAMALWCESRTRRQAAMVGQI
jgi:O-antigen/teichoic acid export membrane protein